MFYSKSNKSTEKSALYIHIGIKIKNKIVFISNINNTSMFNNIIYSSAMNSNIFCTSVTLVFNYLIINSLTVTKTVTKQ